MESQPRRLPGQVRDAIRRRHDSVRSVGSASSAGRGGAGARGMTWPVCRLLGPAGRLLAGGARRAGFRSSPMTDPVGVRYPHPGRLVGEEGGRRGDVGDGIGEGEPRPWHRAIGGRRRGGGASPPPPLRYPPTARSMPHSINPASSISAMVPASISSTTRALRGARARAWRSASS